MIYYYLYADSLNVQSRFFNRTLLWRSSGPLQGLLCEREKVWYLHEVRWSPCSRSLHSPLHYHPAMVRDRSAILKLLLEDWIYIGTRYIISHTDFIFFFYPYLSTSNLIRLIVSRLIYLKTRITNNRQRSFIRALLPNKMSSWTIIADERRIFFIT